MTTWNNQQKKAGQASITYNEIGKTYNNAGYSYWGLLQTIYSNLTKTISTFVNQSRITDTTFTNQTKN